MQEPDWIQPRRIDSIDDCYFYHTMDIPNHGVVQGEWDLRGRETLYLGNVSVVGKRVLEIGTASGHLCFAMEKMGATVVAYDLSPDQDWDIVPYFGLDYEQHIQERKERIHKLNNGFWFAHGANGSRARVRYGTVYDIPGNMGPFDICTLGSILLHLRDPFLALQRVTANVRESVIVTDLLPVRRGKALDRFKKLIGFQQKPEAHSIYFLPNADRCAPNETWWSLSPGVIAEFLQILGFNRITVTYHQQSMQGQKYQMYTVVGRRGML